MYKECLYVHIERDLGLGNQLFIVFTGLSLCYKHNRKPVFIYHPNNGKRTPGPQYGLFKNLEFKDIMSLQDGTISDRRYVYNDYSMEFHNIDDNIDNIKLISGYFQSHRYFIDSINDIKRHIYIEPYLRDMISSSMDKTTKKILSIHIRRGDYKFVQSLNLFPHHHIPQVDYYKKALDQYDLQDYQIVLVSDDFNEAKELLEPLNLNFISTRDLHKSPSDMIDFYILMLSDIIIGSASTFSLSAAYLSYMYNFKDSKFIFPKTWFEEKGPKYNITDIIFTENERFTII